MQLTVDTQSRSISIVAADDAQFLFLMGRLLEVDTLTTPRAVDVPPETDPVPYDSARDSKPTPVHAALEDPPLGRLTFTPVRHRSDSIILEARQQIGNGLTLGEAAEGAGVHEGTLRKAMKDAEAAGQTWFAAGKWMFRVRGRYGELADPEDIGEARPRHANAETMPLNPHVVGGR